MNRIVATLVIVLAASFAFAGTAAAQARGSYYWDELTVMSKVNASLWAGRNHVLMANCNGYGARHSGTFGPSFTRFQCEFTRKDFSSFHGILHTTGPSTFKVTNIQN
jgi:hypothetical protein